MDKLTMKRELKNIKRDVEYYTKNYDISQKEAYEILHKSYYYRMMLTKQYVEIDVREEIYKEFKSIHGEEKDIKND